MKKTALFSMCLGIAVMGFMACASESDVDECSYTGKVCKEGKVYQCANGVESMLLDCGDKGCNADNTACNTGSVTPETCSYLGNQCKNGKLYSCANGVESMLLDCGDKGCNADNTACNTGSVTPEPEACNATPTACYDNLNRYECTDGKLTKVPCPEDKSCVNNECVDIVSDITCDFEDLCASDNRGIRKCLNGVVSYEACENTEACDDSDGVPTCVDTVVDGVCTASFNDYCESDRWLHYCDDPDEAGPQRKDCGDGKCVGNRCVVNSKTFGDDCNPETFDETCIGNVIAYCDENSKKVSRRDDCAAEGGICGIVVDNNIPRVDCFEACTVQGSMRNVCAVASDQAWQYQDECILVDSGLGDGRLGYLDVADSWAQCDIGCAEGKCFDYTEGIPGIGETCDPNTKADFCQGDLAVTCSFVDSGYILEAEKCYADEVCIVENGTDEATTAHCTKTCTPGSVKTECGTGLFPNVVFTYPCVEQDGKYFYSTEYSSMKSCDDERKQCSDGQCI